MRSARIEKKKKMHVAFKKIIEKSTNKSLPNVLRLEGGFGAPPREKTRCAKRFVMLHFKTQKCFSVQNITHFTF